MNTQSLIDKEINCGSEQRRTLLSKKGQRDYFRKSERKNKGVCFSEITPK